MFRHILVPLDGSRYAEQALPVAARLAQSSHGTMTLIQVINPADNAMPASLPEESEKRTGASKDYLEHVLQRPYLSHHVSRMEVISGDPASAIAEIAARPPVDLVVLASHGYTGVRRWFQESVAEHLARIAPVPVLMLHDHKPLRVHRNIDGTSFIRALVPLDDSEVSLAAVIPAARFVNAFSTPGLGEVHLARVVVSTGTESMPDLETQLQAARQQLKARAQLLHERLKMTSEPDFSPPLFIWAATLEGSVAEGIVRRAEHGEKHAETKSARTCDVIVMTTHNSTDRQKWAKKSITERVLRATHLPVLIVHPAKVSMEKEQPHADLTHGAVR